MAVSYSRSKKFQKEIVLHAQVSLFAGCSIVFGLANLGRPTCLADALREL
jgi:hypothetical protein